MIRRTIYSILCVMVMLPIWAGRWTTHFAYNNVTQIAMAPDRVYAISDGSLFSVDKQSEQIRVYNRQSGLSSTGITCIHYDEIGKQLIIGYGTGKIDILSSRGVRYIGELYDKDMTQLKTIYNVTISGRTAYLSTAYGIQTMDLREDKLVDSYWLRPNGQETAVKDVLIANDSIYAFADDSLFCASLQDNIVDYTVWRREAAGRVAPEAEKGVHYQDATNHWYAGHAEGIVRFTQTARLTYKPEGPLVNKAYAISAQDGHVYVVAGGRWVAQDETPGHLMHYDGSAWHNTPAEKTRQFTQSAVLDFMNVAIDPTDVHHVFVASYGTGLYEFRGDSCVYHTLANDVIGSAVVSAEDHYTRLAGAHYDSAGRLWFLNAGGVEYPIIIKTGDSYSGLHLIEEGVPSVVHIPQDIIIDSRKEDYKWIISAYKDARVTLLDDRGTPLDETDDRSLMRKEWTSQQGSVFKPVDIFFAMQDRQGRIWLATDQGAAYIDASTDFFTSDAIVRPEVMDNNGENPITTLRMKALCQTPDGRIWIGSEGLGVYVLNEEANEIVAHYTTDNSAMSSNGILSLCADAAGHVWIGTAEGLVEFDPDGPDEGLRGAEKEESKEPQEGSMLRWRLHLSYSNPEEIAATPQRVFARANGALFSVNRADDAIEYWSKATGLNGTSVGHIAYDTQSERLVIAYENGQLDLLDANGNVTFLPDISMKAGAIDVAINSIYVGSKQVYLAMSFGIIAVDAKKGEVSDTYYIGSNAATVEVQQIAEKGDSLYAFSYDRLYKASLQDNLVDYSFWQSEVLPFEQVQHVAVHNHQLYILANDQLYRREGSTWQLVRSEEIAWMHVGGQQLLVYPNGKGLCRLTEEDQLAEINKTYTAQDAVYTNGEYWIAEESKGLVRLGTSGDDFFRPEGPLSNFGYNMTIAHDQLYVAPGGRWAEQFGRQSSLSIYDGQQWRGIPWPDTWYYTNHDIRDAVSYAVDASDPSHFFVATYGTGVFEFKDYKAVQHYDSVNSTLRKAAPKTSDYYFTRTDGAMMDEKGNLWVMNATTTGKAVHVRTQFGQWFALRLTDLTIETPKGIWMDQRNSHRKWMMSQRGDTKGLILLDDNGTPTVSSDDRCMIRSSFVDQNGNTLTPAQYRCFAQDQTNRIWIGTDKGVILLSKETDFFTSNACRRIIIPRNDGTGLGDYLLGDEQINCMAVDGGNRMWIGTTNSGLYLIEDDTITVAHFTETNSLLPSNNVQSIAIMPKTGEVFIGTDKGIASYRSDASEAQEDMKQAYAYPNPVRPNYVGTITIVGLMDNTTVNIIDESGNLVCKTKSHGGTAVWDGKLADGRRATPGVYTALCNAEGGHTVVKILVIR